MYQRDVLHYACYFKCDQHGLKSIVDFIISQQLDDGGFNCLFNRSGAVHSSLHSTISILEGILEYKNYDYTYQLTELEEIEKEAREFILQYRLYRSDKTREMIDKRF